MAINICDYIECLDQRSTCYANDITTKNATTDDVDDNDSRNDDDVKTDDDMTKDNVTTVGQHDIHLNITATNVLLLYCILFINYKK